MSDTNTRSRTPRTLRDRIGDLEPVSREVVVRGEARVVERPGNGSLGALSSALNNVIEDSAGLGQVDLLTQAREAVQAYYESVKELLDTVPESHRGHRDIVVGDLVLCSKKASEALVALFGPEPREVVEIDFDMGLVYVAGLNRPIPRERIIEKSMAEMVANRRPRGGAQK